MNNHETKQESWPVVHRTGSGESNIGQASFLPKGEVCLRSLLRQGEMGTGVSIDSLKHSQNVYNPHETHGSVTREVACAVDGCKESVTVHAETNSDGEEIVDSYQNLRVSKVFEKCKRKPSDNYTTNLVG